MDRGQGKHACKLAVHEENFLVPHALNPLTPEPEALDANPPKPLASALCTDSKSCLREGSGFLRSSASRLPRLLAHRHGFRGRVLVRFASDF